jgi:hypothetical protein
LIEPRAASLLVVDPADPVELSYVLRFVLERYVATHGNTPITQIEILGALEATKAEAYLMPSKLPGAH